MGNFKFKKVNPDELIALYIAKPAKSLSDDEIAKLYPGAKINRTPLTEEQQFDRLRKNIQLSGGRHFKHFTRKARAGK